MIAAPEFVAGRENWMSQGKCVGLGHIMFPERGDSCNPARAVCATCPVKQQCAEYGIANPGLDGVWGGLSHRQRRAIFRARRKAAGLHPRGPLTAEQKAAMHNNNDQTAAHPQVGEST